MSVCNDLPVLECDVPREGIELDLVLQPREPVNGEPQYWPLYNAENPGSTSAICASASAATAAWSS
ncbi:hypothetical protein [Microbulbifer taiwanensis]|uniref:hypothetical protein n=1 Tax=Microbulbifer taiwanensis TaxID=986746 RepID=UPI00360CC3A4